MRGGWEYKIEKGRNYESHWLGSTEAKGWGAHREMVELYLIVKKVMQLKKLNIIMQGSL